MKIIFASKKDSYEAVKAAYKHMNIDEKKADPNCNLGKIRLYYIGLDDENNQIYVSNYYKNKHIFKNIVQGLGKIYDEKVIILDIDK